MKKLSKILATTMLLTALLILPTQAAELNFGTDVCEFDTNQFIIVPDTNCNTTVTTDIVVPPTTTDSTVIVPPTNTDNTVTIPSTSTDNTVTVPSTNTGNTVTVPSTSTGNTVTVPSTNTNQTTNNYYYKEVTKETAQPSTTTTTTTTNNNYYYTITNGTSKEDAQPSSTPATTVLGTTDAATTTVTVSDTGSSKTKLKLSRPVIRVYSNKKSFVVGYKAIKGASGYQIRYIQGGSEYKINTGVTTKKVITPGKGKTTVYVRAFCKKDGKTIYSKWSQPFKVTVK